MFINYKREIYALAHLNLSTWPMAYTTACTTVQAVMLFLSLLILTVVVNAKL